MNEQLKKRIQSLIWRGAMMAVAVFVDFILANLGVFEFNGMVTTVIGLVLGEVSKYLNRKTV